MGQKPSQKSRDEGKAESKIQGKRKGLSRPLDFGRKGKPENGGAKERPREKGTRGVQLSQVHPCGKRKGVMQVNNARGVSEKSKKRGKGKVEGKAEKPDQPRATGKGGGRGRCATSGGEDGCVPREATGKKPIDWERR